MVLLRILVAPNLDVCGQPRVVACDGYLVVGRYFFVVVVYQVMWWVPANGEFVGLYRHFFPAAGVPVTLSFRDRFGRAFLVGGLTWADLVFGLLQVHEVVNPYDFCTFRSNAFAGLVGPKRCLYV